MLTSVFSWLTATSIGKAILRWTGIAALVAAGYWRIYASGKAAAQSEHVADELNALKERNRIDDKVLKMGDDDVRRELSRWVRR